MKIWFQAGNSWFSTLECQFSFCFHPSPSSSNFLAVPARNGSALPSYPRWYQMKQGVDGFLGHSPMAYTSLVGRGARGRYTSRLSNYGPMITGHLKEELEWILLPKPPPSLGCLGHTNLWTDLRLFCIFWGEERGTGRSVKTRLVRPCW